MVLSLQGAESRKPELLKRCGLTFEVIRLINDYAAQKLCSEAEAINFNRCFKRFPRIVNIVWQGKKEAA